MQAPRVGLRTGILLFAFLAATTAASQADAAPIVVRFDATLTDPDFAVLENDADVDVVAGPEITLANSTNVGNLFFDDEFVDVSSNSALSLLSYRVQGGGGEHPLDSNYSLTGWGLLATLAFSNLELDVAGAFTGVTLAVDTVNGDPRVIGAAGGALVAGVDYLFDPLAESLIIYLGGLGVLNAEAPALGTLTFTLALQAEDPDPPAEYPSRPR